MSYHNHHGPKHWNEKAFITTGMDVHKFLKKLPYFTLKHHLSQVLRGLPSGKLRFSAAEKSTGF